MYRSEQKPAAAVISIAIMLLMSVPFVAFAQVEPTLATPTETRTDPVMPTETAVPETTAPETQVTTEEQSTETVQETATSTQETTPAEILEGTANPEGGATETEPIIIETSTSTPETVPEIIPIDEAPATELAPDEIPVEAASDLTVVASDIKPESTELSNAELNALIEPDFVMQISGKTIPTNRKLGDSESVSTHVDPTEGVLTVSGSCSDVYYVVLLYKNQTDYEADPSKYILNRAYDCVNGSYSYEIKNIPVSIQNGTYYLLIGEQGASGSWRPVTELQEITINRAN